MRQIISLIILVSLISFSCQNNQKPSLKTQPFAEKSIQTDTVKIKNEVRKTFNVNEVELKLIKKGNGVTENDLKQTIDKPFDIKTTNTDDTLSIEFSFISACCQMFKKKVEINNDTLFLDYENSEGKSCDCIGKYKYIYKIKDFNLKKIYLHKTMIK